MASETAERLVADDQGWKHPAPAFRVMRRTQVAVLTFVVGSMTGVSVGLGSGPTPGLVGAAILAALGVVVGVFVERRVRAWGYREREDDLMVRRGVLFARLSVVPYGRMQFIDVTAGPVERAFGLATVRMHTAAAASDARIPGLNRADAARLRDHLALLGEARAAGL